MVASGEDQGAQLQDASRGDEIQHALTDSAGLSSLQNLRNVLDLDERRADASVKLTKSMNDWIARKSPQYSLGHEEGESPVSPSRLYRMSTMSPRMKEINGRRSCLDTCIVSLEEAFLAHSAAFDLDGDGTICVEELILILERCGLFDEFFTPNKIRNYFTTWADGCNYVQGLTEPLQDHGISFLEFKDVLLWGADIKGASFSDCAKKVVRLSRKLCDKSSSVQHRLEVVFDAFCKTSKDTMTAFEFGTLCQKIGIYEEDKFSMGDVYSLFFKISGVVHGQGVGFAGFIAVVGEVGSRLEIGEQVFEVFAKAVEQLETDHQTQTKVKMRMKHAAGIVGGNDWRHFFHMCDPDKSGNLDWTEFLVMCREKLHLNDRDSHLQLIFDKLDEDGSGELRIDALCSFIES